MKSVQRRLAHSKKKAAATRSISTSLTSRRTGKNRTEKEINTAKNPAQRGCDAQSNIIYNDMKMSQPSVAKSCAVRWPLSEPKVIHLICQEGQILHRVPPDLIDLSPLMIDPAAAEILMLARGQLNRAFRTHGLTPPDPLPLGDSSDIDPKELDDPAALGIDNAMARFEESFLTWSSRMPLALARPVLNILRQTCQALGHQRDDTEGPGVAALKAHDFLLGRQEWDEGMPNGI
jgi:hypothetical protein